MIVDMHIHTNRSSYCSSLSPQELLDRTKELRLDAIAVTEHSVTRGAQIAYEMGLEQGVTVFRGIEVYTKLGDIIVFGLGEDTHYDADFHELIKDVREKRALAIAAHPTRGYWGHHRKYKGSYCDEIFQRVDAIETHNGQSSLEANAEALVIQKRAGIPGTGGSDAHSSSHVGRCVTVFENNFNTEEELVREIKAGRCCGAYIRGTGRSAGVAPRIETARAGGPHTGHDEV